MARQQVFDLKTLHLVGRLAEDFDEQCRMLVRDCRERPGLKKRRKLQITLWFDPVETGDDVIVHCETTNSLPTRSAETYRMMATAKDGLKFQPDSPERPDQEGLDFGE